MFRWYGVGGTIQLAIFGMVAAQVKLNANGAHTFLEVRCMASNRLRSIDVFFLDCPGSVWEGPTLAFHVLCFLVHHGCLRIAFAYVNPPIFRQGCCYI